MLITLPVSALRCAEKRTNEVSSPITAMMMPTTSSFRSALRESHQERETGSGVAGSAALPLLGIDLLLFLPREAVTVLPFGLALDLGEISGTFNGIFVV